MHTSLRCPSPGGPDLTKGVPFAVGGWASLARRGEGGGERESVGTRAGMRERSRLEKKSFVREMPLAVRACSLQLVCSFGAHT